MAKVSKPFRSLATNFIASLALLLLAVGVVATIVLHVFWPASNGAVAAVADRLAGAMISAGTIAFLWNLLTRRRLADELLELVQVRDSLADLGLKEVHTHHPSDKNLDDAFESNSLAVICICDFDLRDRYSSRILKMLERGGTVTISMPDWTNPSVVSELAQRRFSPGTLNDIERLETYFLEQVSAEVAHKNWNGTVRSRRLPFVPAYTSYIFKSGVKEISFLRLLGNSLTHTGSNPLLVVGSTGSLREFLNRDTRLVEELVPFQNPQGPLGS